MTSAYGVSVSAVVSESCPYVRPRWADGWSTDFPALSANEYLTTGGEHPNDETKLRRRDVV